MQSRRLCERCQGDRSICRHLCGARLWLALVSTHSFALNDGCECCSRRGPLLSLIVPVVVAVVGRRPQALLASGLAMGLGIAGMHYTGMAAMRMAAFIESDPAWVVLSIVIAVSASVVALWLAFRLTRRSRPRCANKSKPGRSLRFGRKARECLR